MGLEELEKRVASLESDVVDAPLLILSDGEHKISEEGDALGKHLMASFGALGAAQVLLSAQTSIQKMLEKDVSIATKAAEESLRQFNDFNGTMDTSVNL
jgi:hypothetical protein